MSESDVARIKRQIELEYEAGRRVFQDFSEVAHHQFITQRQENIANHFNDLTQYVSKEEALQIVIAAENGTSGEDNASA